MDNIKAILIDVDDTLLDFAKCARTSMQNAAKELSLVLPDGVETVFHNVNDGLWKKVECGEITAHDIYAVRWNIVFGKFGIDFDGPLFESHFRENLKTVCEKVDGADELLSYLSKKYPVYIATNALFLQQKIRLEKSGILPYIKGLFVSEQIGAAKPSSEFFKYCLSSLSLPSENVVMIGDSASADIAGAKNLGIKTIWFNKKRKAAEGVLCDFTVNSLDEIKDLL